ncbi:hypothetical protein [Bradyrhizobium erythrophlei]|uniref:Uncharacterized protein n=1 Tax=Bradyrhizobium erythrophlei TaxID=1437360 RepID=A0A1M5NF80_9BRAD|nr:hypothetical protein [Bradyrhizobium erythrophlei]SHG87623.1 hypothetical protein SAMN05443248_2951 [Bradyrhizobium erythrophlei]
MIREFIIGVSMIDIHRRLRREGMKLIRLEPRTLPQGGGIEAYVALYVKA